MPAVASSSSMRAAAARKLAELQKAKQEAAAVKPIDVVFVKFHDKFQDTPGDFLTLPAKNETTVDELRSVVSAHESVKLEHETIEFLFEGKNLSEGGASLAACGLENQSMLHVALIPDPWRGHAHA